MPGKRDFILFTDIGPDKSFRIQYKNKNKILLFQLDVVHTK
jgi:hypothetical protein